MLNWLIEASLRQRLVVCVAAALLMAVGVRTLLLLPIDAFPDTTPVQVQVNTVAPALSPEEIENQITVPIELEIGGLPGLQNVRSISKFGLSQVTATFVDGTSVILARQLLGERLLGVELPDGIERPKLGPIATGLGEVFHYIVRSDDSTRSLQELREIHDWVIKPALRRVPGVAEVNSWGGFEKQYAVVFEPRAMVKYGVTLSELAGALQSNNRNAGGGLLTRSGEALLLHGLGRVNGIPDIERIPVLVKDGAVVRVSDLARVEVGHEIRRGAVTADGRGEAVLGLGFMLMGENSHVVTRRLAEALKGVQASLPTDVRAEVVYDRTDLVDRVIRTVEHNLLWGAVLVIAVLFAFLGNFRAGLIVASAIPLSMLFAGSLMLQTGIAASLLSLGAVDFGLVVDSSVIMVENCVRRLAHEPGGRSRLDIVRDAAIEVRKPTMFGELIIMLVFLPILTLEGVEGKLFRPMALTMIFALFGSMVLSLTLMPVLASLVLGGRLRETEPWLVRAARWAYAPLLDGALRFRGAVLAGAALVVAGSGFLALTLGGEFLPKLKEGALTLNVIRLAGVSTEEAARSNTRIETVLLEAFPDEIGRIWSRIGTAEVATDPMGIELTDVFIALKPNDDWTKAATQEELAAAMTGALGDFPGVNVVVTQPIEMRMNEMIAGIRSEIGIKIYGDDFDTLVAISNAVQSVLLDVPGVVDISGEQITGQPVVRVVVDTGETARLGVSVDEVMSVVEAVGGIPVGEVREGQRRFPLVVRIGDEQRSDPGILESTLLTTDAGAVVPLGQVARFHETEGPTTINREWSRRRITVQCNVRGRDVESVVTEARARVSSGVRLPVGYGIEWGGQFESMQRANRRLLFVVPLTLGLIFALLYFSLRSVRDVLVVATGIPFGAVGGVAALALRGIPFSVSSAIGFIALSGIAILNGLVLVTFIRQRLDAGLDVPAAVRESCLVRLRPVLMTALVAAVGFIPMAINTGVGAEVQRPLATVVIGGVLSNTLLTLLVLPALYAGFGRDGRRRVPE
jgi:cobalt-zinc-cadmium resistance protein CzcA